MTKRPVPLSLCGVVALLAATGCAGERRAEPLPVAMSRVVLEYQPASTEEAMTLEYLRLQDALAREEIEKAVAALDEFKPDSDATTDQQRAQFTALVETLRGLLQRQDDQYKRFFALYPGNWHARHLFAGFLTDTGRRYEAAEEWRAVIRMEPNFPYAHNNLGTLYNHMGRDLEAILLYRKFIELKDDDATVWLNLAVNYSTHRQDAMKEFGWDLPRTFQECLAAYTRARALEPADPEIARSLALQYVWAKYFEVTNTADEALAAWDYYLGLNLTPGERGQGLMNKARIWLREKNDPAEALRLLRQAKRISNATDMTDNLIRQAEEALKGQPSAR